MQKTIANMVAERGTGSAQDFGAFIEADIAKWGPIVKALNLQTD